MESEDDGPRSGKSRPWIVGRKLPDVGKPSADLRGTFLRSHRKQFLNPKWPFASKESFSFLQQGESCIMATKLMPLRPSGSALRSLSRRRPSQHAFSTTPAIASLSPQSKSNKKITLEP